MNSDFVRKDLIPETLPAPKNARPVVAPAIFVAETNYGYGPGCSDAPKAATAEFGETVRKACVQGLSEFFIKLHRLPPKA